MSARRSLTWAVRDQLRATVVDGGLALTAAECDVMADGKPAPGCGKTFVSIHQGSRSNNWLSGDESEFGVNCTCTIRTNAPFDRIGTAEIDALDGLDDLGDAVWNCIFAHQWGVSPTGVMNKANLYLASINASNYFWTEALYPATMTEAQPVREEWFQATRTAAQGRGSVSYTAEAMQFCGFQLSIRFAGAKRMQVLSDALA